MRAALVTAALATVALMALASGCSVGIPEVVLEGPAVPLAIAGPREGLVYTAADDEDPDAPGIQLILRVDVHEGIGAGDVERVDLALPDDAVSLSDVVAEDLEGRRAAFFEVTLRGGAEHPVVATTPAFEGAEVREILVAAR